MINVQLYRAMKRIAPSFWPLDAMFFSLDPSEFLSFDFEKSNVKWKEINQNKSIFGSIFGRKTRRCPKPKRGGEQEEEKLN